MRSSSAALLALLLVAPSVRAADLRFFDDACLRAIQFVDANEGWAVGDEGVIWHTIDGGGHWERQPTGTRASLRGLHFMTPFLGWVAGREELPDGSGSTGVLLFTTDGGLHWQKVAGLRLPGLQVVRFVDSRIGFVAGEGTDQAPSGVFRTTDAGRTWTALPGARTPGWLDACFFDGETGLLVGAWGRMAQIRQGVVTPADIDPPGGRSLTSIHALGKRAVAVGQGGLVLSNADAPGGSWSYADTRLPPTVAVCFDLHGLHGHEEHLWAVGRPGTTVLHSADAGKTWETFQTGQPLPLQAVYFMDERQGWAVGTYGSILGTKDGGKTWRVQRRGGQRSGALFLHARGESIPLDTIALLGGDECYLTNVLRVVAPDSASASMERAAAAERLQAAVRQVGGGAGEMLWQFPLPEHGQGVNRAQLLALWEQLHATNPSQELLRQLVLALRTWRPEIVITDHPDLRQTGNAIDALVTEALDEAIRQAADAQAFPEQIKQLGLEAWLVKRTWSAWHEKAGAQVAISSTDVNYRLESSLRDFVTPASRVAGEGPETLPTQRFYRLLGSRVADADRLKSLMHGIELAPGGEARRSMPMSREVSPELEKALRERRNLQALAEAPSSPLVDANRSLVLIGGALDKMPESQSAPAAYAIANQFARTGQWTQAREVFMLLTQRYPTHPLAIEAGRWLVRYQASSEARRRQELGHFRLESTTAGQQTPEAPPREGNIISGGVEIRQHRQLSHLGSLEDTRRWFEECLDHGRRLAAVQPGGLDPATGFCLSSARRHLGDFDGARQWSQRLAANQATGPWKEAAEAEGWITRRTPTAPKVFAYCRQATTRPVLDGSLEDACWQGLKPIVFKPAVGDTTKQYPTEGLFAWDKDFLYLALRCQHPSDQHVPPVRVRTRDAALQPYDRVSLLLDLDRDYASWFHLQIDQRGCLREECSLGREGGTDPSWNPRWFVAIRSETTGWQIEAAIPLTELTGETVTAGQVWTFNLVRVLPGRGVQAGSLPADVQPRPEGMGLLVFTTDELPKKANSPAP